MHVESKLTREESKKGMWYTRVKREERQRDRYASLLAYPPRSLLSRMFRKGGGENAGEEIKRWNFLGSEIRFFPGFLIVSRVRSGRTRFCRLKPVVFWKISSLRSTIIGIGVDNGRVRRPINLVLSGRQYLAVRTLTLGVRRPCTRLLFNSWPSRGSDPRSYLSGYERVIRS